MTAPKKGDRVWISAYGYGPIRAEVVSVEENHGRYLVADPLIYCRTIDACPAAHIAEGTVVTCTESQVRPRYTLKQRLAKFLAGRRTP